MRAIVVMATTLILSAGQAMAEGLTPPRHVTGASPGFIPLCYCTCLDKPCEDCLKCLDDELGRADGRPLVMRPITNRYSSTIRGATPYFSALPRSARCEH
jgi:hypothetical protein